MGIILGLEKLSNDKYMSLDCINICIVLVNYKGWLDTIECLESVLKIECQNINIVVVDNSPGDDDMKQLIHWAQFGVENLPTSFPHLVYPLSSKPLDFECLNEGDEIKKQDSRLFFIKAKANHGFAAANNIALKLYLENGFNGYFWILNNDTIVTKDALRHLVCKIETDPSLGIVGGCLLYANDSNLIQGLGGLYNPLFATTAHYLEGVPYQPDLLIDEQTIDYPIGASMLVSSNFIRDVGLMNEQFFLYFEELDWVVRGQLKKWCFSVSINAITYHKEGGSIGTQKGSGKSLVSDYWSLRNRIVFTRIYKSKYLLLVYLSFIGVLFNRLRRFQISKFKQVLKILTTT